MTAKCLSTINAQPEKAVGQSLITNGANIIWKQVYSDFRRDCSVS